MSVQGESKLERAEGKGRTREEAVAKALVRLGLRDPSEGSTQIEVVRVGVYGFFGACKQTWHVVVTNLDAVDENRKRKEENRKREEENRKREEENRKREKEKRLALETVRSGLDRGAHGSFWDRRDHHYHIGALVEEDKGIYKFEYPFNFSLTKPTLREVWTNFSHAALAKTCKPELEAISKLRRIASAEKADVLDLVLEGAVRYPGSFNFYLLFCDEMAWLDDLEAVLAKEDRYIDVVKLLAYRGKWEELLGWFREHGKLSESVLLLERLRRFDEAAALLERIPASSWHDCFDEDGTPREHKVEYQAKLAELKAAAAVAQASTSRALSKDDLDKSYAMGELSAEEYERLKARGGEGAAALCPRCGKPVEADFKFCPFCGAKRC